MGAEANSIPVPEARRLGAEMRLAGVLWFTLLTGLGAHVAVPLPPDGVPMTLQSLMVVLAAIGLGPRFGAASMVLYLAMGVIGATFFADGRAGIAHLAGQTGGYLIGFLACQPVVGAIIRRRDGSIRGWGAMVLAVLGANGVIFALGVPWLWAVRHDADPGYTFGDALAGGLYPFLPGLVIKSAMAVVIGRVAAPWASSRIW